MSKKANPTAIGVFVIVAVLIAFTGFIILGSGQLFKNSTSYILQFPGDISGLNVGAPVTFSGVKIGLVTDVSIVYDHATDSITTPVTIEIMRDSFVQKNMKMRKQRDSQINMHIDRGLRAVIASQSMVTGMLKIRMDYFPDTEAVYRLKDSDTDLSEIPTIPTTLNNLIDRINKLPLQDIIVNANKSLNGISKFVNSKDLQEAIAHANESLQGVSKFVNSGKIEEIFDTLSKAIEDVSKTASSTNLQSTFIAINNTLTETQMLLQALNENTKPASREILIAIESFSEATQAVQHFFDYIERHPEALIHGKGKE